MSATPFTASQLNTWMHEHHADTVADLAQRGLAMEFVDAQFGRPMSLRVSSAKADFGFHLPNAHYEHQLEPMMASVRNSAGRFQKAFDSYTSPKFVWGLDGTWAIAQDTTGWQLHLLPPKEWINRPVLEGALLCHECKMPFVSDIVQRAFDEANTLAFIRSELDIPQYANDTKKTTLVEDSLGLQIKCPTLCVLNIKKIGAESTRYSIYLRGVERSEGPAIQSAIFAQNRPSLTNKVDHGFVREGSKVFFLLEAGRPIFIDFSTKIEFKYFPAEAFGMTAETLSMLIQVGAPLTEGMPRFKQATIESYNFDFSMDDQASSSGLSL